MASRLNRESQQQTLLPPCLSSCDRTHSTACLSLSQLCSYYSETSQSKCPYTETPTPPRIRGALKPKHWRSVPRLIRNCCLAAMLSLYYYLNLAYFDSTNLLITLSAFCLSRGTEDGYCPCGRTEQNPYPARLSDKKNSRKGEKWIITLLMMSPCCCLSQAGPRAKRRALKEGDNVPFKAGDRKRLAFAMSTVYCSYGLSILELEYCIFALRPWNAEMNFMHTEERLPFSTVMLPLSPTILLRTVSSSK